MFFQFTASLRLPDSMSPKDKEQRCEEVAESLGLTGCMDTSESVRAVLQWGFCTMFV